MRVIAGVRRGHKLKSFDGMDIRPTTDRVKESMFNMVWEFIPGSCVLDLFGGTGALSFEALSRGADFAVCTDLDMNSVKIIKENAAALKFDNIEILNRDATEYIKNCGKCFSVIFLDPPYNMGFIKPVIENILAKGLLCEDGIIVLESDNSDEHSDFDGLEIIKQKRYGRTYVTVYQRR